MGLRNLNVPNLCGASAEFNTLLNSCQDVKGKLLSQIEADASALASDLASGLQTCTSSLEGLALPQLAVPATSLQAELTNLVTKTVGSPEYASALAIIETKFKDGLAKVGADLDSLVSSALDTVGGTGDICGAIPNFKVSPDGEVFEEAKETLQAAADTVTELVSELSDNEELKTNMTALATDLAKKAEIAATVLKEEAERFAELGIPQETYDAVTGAIVETIPAVASTIPTTTVYTDVI